MPDSGPLTQLYENMTSSTKHITTPSGED